MSVPDWPVAPGYHESGVHVWVFVNEYSGISFEIDAEVRLDLAEARRFHTALGALLEEAQR